MTTSRIRENRQAKQKRPEERTAHYGTEEEKGDILSREAKGKKKAEKSRLTERIFTFSARPQTTQTDRSNTLFVSDNGSGAIDMWADARQSTLHCAHRHFDRLLYILHPCLCCTPKHLYDILCTE